MRDGWYVTGDMARFDEDGFITLTGRLSRFAKVGGEMVPLERIEEELHELLGTAEQVCAVTAVPDEKKGERIVVLHLPLPCTNTRALSQQLAARGLPSLGLPGERDFLRDRRNAAPGQRQVGPETIARRGAGTRPEQRAVMGPLAAWRCVAKASGSTSSASCLCTTVVSFSSDPKSLETSERRLASCATWDCRSSCWSLPSPIPPTSKPGSSRLTAKPFSTRPRLCRPWEKPWRVRPGRGHVGTHRRLVPAAVGGPARVRDASAGGGEWRGPTALVFGPEPTGLVTNAEVTLCHYLIHIPTDPEYQALNLAQAVAISLYELRRAWSNRRRHCPARTAGIVRGSGSDVCASARSLDRVHFLWAITRTP